LNMRYVSDVNVGKSIIHVIDPQGGEPVLANKSMEMNVSELEFITKHVVKALSDDENFRCRCVNKDREVYQSILKIMEDRENLVEESKKMTEKLFEIMKRFDEQPAGDLLFTMFFADGIECLAILKLDYIESYTHQIDFVDGELAVKLVTQETGLPAGGARLKKCAFFKKIGEDDLEILVINKNAKSDPDEIKELFTFEFLGVEIVDDPTSMTRRVRSTFENWARKNLKDDIEKATELRDKVEDVLLNEGDVDVQQIAVEVFQGNVHMQNEMLEEAGKRGLSPSITFPVDKTWVEKKMKAKQIKTDTGLVIKGEYDLFSDSAKFEIRRNGDGTVDYVIKGVRNVSER